MQSTQSFSSDYGHLCASPMKKPKKEYELSKKEKTAIGTIDSKFVECIQILFLQFIYSIISINCKRQ